MSNMQTLPFFFRELPSIEKILLTNQAGSFAYLNNYKELEKLVQQSFSELDKKTREELLSKSIIAERADSEVRIDQIASKLATVTQSNIEQPSLFLVVPTLRCDHDCRYCQVSRVPKNRLGYDLDISQIDSILEIIRRVGTQKIKIEFQGGEPLLAFDYIRRFIERAKQLLKDTQISYVICSALGPLSQEILDWSKESHLSSVRRVVSLHSS